MARRWSNGEAAGVRINSGRSCLETQLMSLWGHRTTEAEREPWKERLPLLRRMQAGLPVLLIGIAGLGVVGTWVALSGRSAGKISNWERSRSGAVAGLDEQVAGEEMREPSLLSGSEADAPRVIALRRRLGEIDGEPAWKKPESLEELAGTVTDEELPRLLEQITPRGSGTPEAIFCELLIQRWAGINPSEAAEWVSQHLADNAF